MRAAAPTLAHPLPPAPLCPTLQLLHLVAYWPLAAAAAWGSGIGAAAFALQAAVEVAAESLRYTPGEGALLRTRRRWGPHPPPAALPLARLDGLQMHEARAVGHCGCCVWWVCKRCRQVELLCAGPLLGARYPQRPPLVLRSRALPGCCSCSAGSF